MIVRVIILNTRKKEEVIDYEINSKYMAKVNKVLAQQWQKTQNDLKRREKGTINHD